MHIRKFKKDVRGAALVYVIVAAALIIVLGAATTATAFVNLKSTQIQEQSDNNFYNADTIVNTIVSGLEGDMSIAYETAYTQVITKLNTYKEDAIKSAESDFNKAFLDALYARLSDGKQYQGETFEFMYSIKKIQKYVQDVYGDDLSYTITALHGNSYVDKIEDEGEEGIILRNLHITYEDDNGYFDEITTDIKIDIPKFDPQFLQQTKLNLEGFVVDDGLEVELSKGLEIVGNTYINERESDDSAVLLDTRSSLSITSPEETVLGGQIKTNENTKLTIQGSTESKDANIIWTENFDFGRHSEALISGQTFVFDDLEVNGTYSNIKLSGEYYGYNQSEKKLSESSSININGAHTTLDIEALDMLVIAGTSYLKTSSVDSGQDGYVNSDDLQLGESMSVKSNQIAYLVDDKEFDSNDIKKFSSNPMSYEQYETMISANGGLNDTLNKLSSKVLSYGKSYKQYGASIVPVFSSKDNGTVYLYLNFEKADDAAKFFTDAFRGNSLLSQRLRTYSAQYISKLVLNTNTSLLVNENYIDPSVSLYTSDTLPQSANGLGYGKTEPDQTAMNETLKKIRLDYLDNGKEDGTGIKYKMMYKKLVNAEKLNEFITNATAAETYMDHHTNDKLTIIENGVILEGTTGSKAILVNNKGKEPYELGTGKGLVVVSGDLKITGDWLGTIIVGGRAYCTDGTKEAPLNITIDSVSVNSVLPLYFTMQKSDDEVSMSVINIFKGYEDMKVNDATSDTGINADMISNCISFINWNRD